MAHIKVEVDDVDSIFTWRSLRIQAILGNMLITFAMHGCNEVQDDKFVDFVYA